MKVQFNETYQTPEAIAAQATELAHCINFNKEKIAKALAQGESIELSIRDGGKVTISP